MYDYIRVSLFCVMWREVRFGFRVQSGATSARNGKTGWSGYRSSFGSFYRGA